MRLCKIIMKITNTSRLAQVRSVSESRFSNHGEEALQLQPGWPDWPAGWGVAELAGDSELVVEWLAYGLGRCIGGYNYTVQASSAADCMTHCGGGCKHVAFAEGSQSCIVFPDDSCKLQGQGWDTAGWDRARGRGEGCLTGYTFFKKSGTCIAGRALRYCEEKCK